MIVILLALKHPKSRITDLKSNLNPSAGARWTSSTSTTISFSA